MSEDRFEQEEPKDEDVEAHRKHRGRDIPAGDELGSDESDDVEAHRRKLTDDPVKEAGGDSDDFELHRKHR